MKKPEMSMMDRLIEILKGEHLPQAVIDDVNLMGQETLERIVFKFENPGWAATSLQAIPGVGPKRAVLILAAIEEALANMRHSVKAKEKISGPSYSCLVFEKEEVWRDYIDLIQEVKDYHYKKDETADTRNAALAAKAKLEKALEGFRFTARAKEGRTIQLEKSILSEVCRVNYDTGYMTNKVVVLHHGIQEMLDFDPHLYDNDVKEGVILKEKWQKAIEEKLIYNGFKVISEDGKETLYGFAASSSGHLKTEKGLCVRADIRKANAEFFWFGQTLQSLATTTTMSGAEYWKMMANLLRPLACPFVDENGEYIKMKDLLIVKDVKKVYLIKNGLKVGKAKGVLLTKGVYAEKVILGDGAIISLIRLKFQGQCSSTGLKGFFVDGTSAIDYVCEKYGLTLEEFYDLEVEGIDGKLHRIGDYKAICGEGCWKFDKGFTYPGYMEWLSNMEKMYPGIDRLYLLRQAEELEDQEKKRTLTRTLIQQWMNMSCKEINTLTARVRNDLVKAKTFLGQVAKRSAAWKEDDEKTDLETLFSVAPWLVTNPVVMMDAENKWLNVLAEAAACKFRTEGVYPYIMQDPVGLLEVWILGAHPDDPTIGVLRGDEVSVADIPDGEELLTVRFPANYLTARIMTNRSMIGPFDSVNGVMIISVHSHVLIIQDGDVDGDEAGVYRNKLAISLTKRMLEKFNPPTILFAHGGKPPRKTRGSIKEFLADCASALWDAKKYSAVGIYANIASRCCYLATVAYKNGDKKAVSAYLDAMAAASTGAIMALDQVKGNDKDLDLINHLNGINRSTAKAIRKIAMDQGHTYDTAKGVSYPYVHYWCALAKREPVLRSTCLEPNKYNFVDMISTKVQASAGSWSDFDMQGAVWNVEAAKKALLYDFPMVNIMNGKITKEMIRLLGHNWFRFTPEDYKNDKAEQTKRKFKEGELVGFKDFILMLHQNEMSMSYSMEGATLAEKRAEYIEVCRELIRMFLDSGDWEHKVSGNFPKGFVFDRDVQWKITVNYLVRDALELEKGNGIKSEKLKGQYAIFVLKLFAKELIENVRKSKIGPEDFSVSHGIVETAREDYYVEKAMAVLELSEEADTQTEQEVPEYDEAPVEYDEAAFEEWAATISDDYIGEPPAEGEEGYFSGDFE